ncbi:MAG: hypothetical protein LQ342_007925 [Letrouitia transgressa]|nr:MAG: hypothetical protein LQ342_007925 [Letrouitia transgressa]
MLSSTQIPTCVVEVGSNNDTALVIKAIGSTRSPFAVISGGHASNPGFSSTPGVLISLVRLKTFAPAADHSSIVLGTGNVWVNDVYPKLDNSGYNVVGGRVTGPAVGGLTLGGGFSWLTNQYGLTCDTVQCFTLVLPNGTISEVDSRQPDLFFALKGGLNRFGIVTQIRFKLFPEVPKVYGGYQIFPPTSIPALINATSTFSATNTDPKAQVILTLGLLASAPAHALLIFYDGPTPPPSLAPFRNIPALFTNISTQSFSSFAKSIPASTSANTRGAFHTLSTTSYTTAFLEAVYNETKFYGALAAAHSGVYISYDVEPFLKTYGKKTTDSAYPHAKSPLPLNLYFTWTLPAEDAFWRGKMQQSVDLLTAVAKREGIWDPELTAYPNYALSTYSGNQLYGSANAARLRKVKAAVDPQGVMDLTGGFRL